MGRKQVIFIYKDGHLIPYQYYAPAIYGAGIHIIIKDEYPPGKWEVSYSYGIPNEIRVSREIFDRLKENMKGI